MTTSTSKLISVNELLPPAGEEVVVLNGNKFLIGWMFDDGTWATEFCNDWEELVDVTHWAPLPELPVS